MSADESANRWLIVGGGFGGLPPARFLTPANVARKASVGANRPAKPPPVPTSPLSNCRGMIPPGQCACLRATLLQAEERPRSRRSGFRLEPARCTASVAGLQPLEIPDTLIVAASVNQSYFGHDGTGCCPRHEDDRRRSGASATDLRSLRDGGDGFRTPQGGAGGGCHHQGRHQECDWPVGQIELAVRSLRGGSAPSAASIQVVALDGGKEPLASFGGQLSARRRGAPGVSAWAAHGRPGRRG